MLGQWRYGDALGSGGADSHASRGDANHNGGVAEGHDGTPFAGGDDVEAMEQVDHGFDGGGLAAEGDVDPVGTVSRWVAARWGHIHGWVS